MLLLFLLTLVWVRLTQRTGTSTAREQLHFRFSRVCSAASSHSACAMALNVTDTTCSYGLARTSKGCVITLATLAGDSYTRMQIVYCVAGFTVMSVSTYKLACAVRTRGAMLQKQIFALCMYAALTITLRGVDPSGYGHYIPRPVSSFLADSCTATLHTILYVHSTAVCRPTRRTRASRALD